MPLYYFDLRDDDKLVPDEEGTEVPSLDEVQNEAAHALADLLSDTTRSFLGIGVGAGLGELHQRSFSGSKPFGSRGG